jgi:hypothetical protein
MADLRERQRRAWELSQGTSHDEPEVLSLGSLTVPSERVYGRDESGTELPGTVASTPAQPAEETIEQSWELVVKRARQLGANDTDFAILVPKIATLLDSCPRYVGVADEIDALLRRKVQQRQRREQRERQDREADKAAAAAAATAAKAPARKAPLPPPGPKRRFGTWLAGLDLLVLGLCGLYVFVPQAIANIRANHGLDGRSSIFWAFGCGVLAVVGIAVFRRGLDKRP